VQIQQHPPAIVNPDAAGNDLINKCEAYKQSHGLLPLSAVIHTTAGKLRPHIEHVIHTVGPRDDDYIDKSALLTVLTDTFHNVIQYASETLRDPQLCIPAISSGIFQVPLVCVVQAFHAAITRYTHGYSQTSHTPILQCVRLINNSQAETETAAQIFVDLHTACQSPTVETHTLPTTPNPSGRQAKRRRRANARVEECMDIWTPDVLRRSQGEDTDIQAVIGWIASDSKPDWNTVRAHSPALKAYWHLWESLTLTDGILYRQLEPSHASDDIVKQLMLPQALRIDFLDSVHTGLAGHMGMTKTAAHVTRRAYWYQWRRDVNLSVRRCPKCSTYHRGRIPPRQGNLVPLLTGAPVERWAIDLAGPFPKSTKGHVYIMTVIDVFSKYIILVPLRDRKAITVAQAIYERVFLKYGAGEILTDNGGEFRNELLSELCRLMGVSRRFTTAYHARCNAVCERSHATVNSMLAKCIDTNQRNWTDHLQQVLFCFNASIQESTQHSPFFLMHGTEPLWNIHFQMGAGERQAYSVNDYADLLITRLETAHAIVRQHLGTAARRMSDWYDKKVHTQSFLPGDQVFVLNLRQYKGLRRIASSPSG